ncbi:hypothetical protein AB6V29_13395 [Microbacterium sp. 20-116]|uniref:DUF7882 family protein n=1 Tax=Microbacterium sp. 20-116 TaxID=3239883 RepID=UPI0034E1CB7F
MGLLYYGSIREPLPLPDVSLAYLQAIAVAKLKRNEAFFASWRIPREVNDARLHIWLHPAIALRFVIDAQDGVALRPAIVDQLMRTAATSMMGVDLDVVTQTAHASVGFSPVSPGS